MEKNELSAPMVALAAGFAAVADEKVDAKKLVGKWEPAKPDPKGRKTVLEFMGAGNFFSATVNDVDGSVVTAVSPAGFGAALLCDGCGVRKGDSIRFVVRPEKLELRAAEPAAAEGRAAMEVTVEQRVYQGVATVWMVRNRAGEVMTAYQQNDAVAGEDQAFVEMGRAWACWDPRHAVVLKESV